MAFFKYMDDARSFFGSDSSRALALLRWPLAMCIVAVHWFMWVLIVPALGLDADTAELPSLAALTKFVTVFLSDNGVASFFFISGYLFFAGEPMTRERYKKKVYKRVFSLLIPYILWNVLYLLFIRAHYLPVFSSLFPRMQEVGFTMTWGQMLKGMFFTASPHNASLWFIRELMTCVILVPLLYRGICRWPQWLMAAFGIAYLVALHYELQYLSYLADSLFFFTLGAALSVRGCDLVRTAAGKGWMSALLFLAGGAAYWYCMERWPMYAAVIKFAGLLNVILLAVCIASWFARRGVRANTFLTGATFFVFASHPFLIAHFTMFLARVFKPQSDLAITGLYFIGYFALLALLLGSYWLLAKVSPKAAAWLTGKRSR